MGDGTAPDVGFRRGIRHLRQPGTRGHRPVIRTDLEGNLLPQKLGRRAGFAGKAAAFLGLGQIFLQLIFQPFQPILSLLVRSLGCRVYLNQQPEGKGGQPVLSRVPEYETGQNRARRAEHLGRQQHRCHIALQGHGVGAVGHPVIESPGSVGLFVAHRRGDSFRGLPALPAGKQGDKQSAGEPVVLHDGYRRTLRDLQICLNLGLYFHKLPPENIDSDSYHFNGGSWGCREKNRGRKPLTFSPGTDIIPSY